MSLSFTLKKPLATASQPGRKERRVLVTGAAGKIGSAFAEHAGGKYDLRLMVRKDEDAKRLDRYGEAVLGQLDDLDKLKTFCRGIDTVVHLAADPSPEAVWDSLLKNNIVGTYHVMVAAKSAGCRRVVYASSIHAVSGYPADMQVKTVDPVNPGDLYGVTKCFGEALGRYMAEQEGLSVIALRIGAFQPHEAARDGNGLWMLDAWVSLRDLNQLIEKCIDDEKIQWAVFHGLSDNRFKRLDITDPRQLVGYAPQDDLTEEHPELKKLRLDENVMKHSRADRGSKSGIREDV